MHLLCGDSPRKSARFYQNGQYFKFVFQTYIVVNDSKKQDAYCTICCEEALSDVMENSEIIQCLDKGSHFACSKVLCYVTYKTHFTQTNRIFPFLVLSYRFFNVGSTKKVHRFCLIILHTYCSVTKRYTFLLTQQRKIKKKVLKT